MNVRLLTVLCAAPLLFCGLRGALSKSTENSAEFAVVRAQIDDAVEKHVAPSISIAAVRSGRIVWAYAAGYANIERKQRATIDTVYRIGSVSKSITGTAAAIAQHNRIIDLSKPLGTYLPAFGNESNKHLRSVPLADLLNMQAGMVQAVHYRGMPNDLTDLVSTKFVQDFASAPLSRSKRYSYSNMGPQLVADAVSAAAQRTFQDYMQDNLLNALGMHETFFSAHAVPASLLPCSYRTNLSPFGSTFDTDPLSGAGYLSSVRDLAGYAIFHLSGQAPHGTPALDSAELAALHEPKTGTFYTFGWGKIGAGKFAVLLSDGQVNGGQTAILLMPQRALAVVAAANSANGEVAKVALAALNVMAPGVAAAFEGASAHLEADRARDAQRFLPTKSPWRAKGTLAVGGQVFRLEATTTGRTMVLRLNGAPFGTGEADEPDDGFAQWKIPCAKILPACVQLTRPDATLALTRGVNGFDGMIDVGSLLGLFPYEVHLQMASVH